mmetsp:Transcript_14847/g.33691  ORF Transcript_14847/g.33691 Transcript_14847/m.33691 type:complete len:109 (-) Transcript_14847:941-1267(-)
MLSQQFRQEQLITLTLRTRQDRKPIQKIALVPSISKGCRAHEDSFVDPTSWVPLTLRQTCCQEFPDSAMCVQNLDDSRGIAIRTTYRISLRSSSLWEPRHPLLKVVKG